jgi:hypothetical protein
LVNHLTIKKYFFHTLLSYIYIGNVKRNVARNITGIITLYLLTLANRNYPICVALPKVAKASTVVDCRVSLSPTVSLTNVANVNDPLLKSYENAGVKVLKLSYS